MSNRNLVSASQRRLLGDLRRETSSAERARAHKRQLITNDDGDDDDDDEENTIRPVSGGLDDNDVAIFADAAYDDDDAEADAIYEAVEERMQSRRKKQREANVQAELKKYRDANPTIRQQFADLKHNLDQVSNDEWASIPDIGNYSVKKQKFERFTPAPDSLLEKARQETAIVASEADTATIATDLATIAAGRTSLLEQNLDHDKKNISANNTVDATGYLNELTGVKISTESEIGDIKKARLLLKSIIQTNPSHAPGWIAAARLEETSGKLSNARKLILNGCRKVPKDEDIWLEAARLHARDLGRGILAQAVKSVPTSVKIWMQAANLEDSIEAKKRVIRKALEVIPRSALLWKTAVDMEEEEGAKLLLRRAVICVPKANDLWLALAKLESYEEAKNVLHRGRLANPQQHVMWLTEAKLEEAKHGSNYFGIQSIICEAIKKFSKDTNEMTREDWIKEAIDANQAKFYGTVRSIITNISDIDVKIEERNRIWISIAMRVQKEGHIEVARIIYDHLVSLSSNNIELWRQYAEFEDHENEIENTRRVLSRAVQACPESEIVWLMLAKQAWKSGSGDEARKVLKKAFEGNENSTQLWLAAAKVETEMKSYDRARYLLETARKEAPSANVFMKSALLERELGNGEKEKSLLQDGLARYSNAYKLWLMLAQWYERNENKMKDCNTLSTSNMETNPNNPQIEHLNNALAVYKTSVQHCEKCVWLWIGYARREESSGTIGKARAILERALQKCDGIPTIDLIWRERIYLEVRAMKPQAARSLLSRALQACTQSGYLWALSIAIEPLVRQKSRSVDAIKACPHNVQVITEVARYIWRTGKIDKARQWMQRAVKLDADWGDAWASWLAFEQENGDENGIKQVVADCIKVQPCHGDVWTFVNKQVGWEGKNRDDVLKTTARLVGKNTSTTGIYELTGTH